MSSGPSALYDFKVSSNEMELDEVGFEPIT